MQCWWCIGLQSGTSKAWKESVERKKGQKNEKKRKEKMKDIKCKKSFQLINLQGEEKVEKWLL
jgi:hypothetical protein